MATYRLPFRLSRVALAVTVLGTAFGAFQAAMFYITLQQDPAAAVALSLVLLVVSVAVLAGLRERWLTSTG